jgi:amylosucrase
VNVVPDRRAAAIHEFEARLCARFEALGVRLERLYPGAGADILARMADILRRAHARRPNGLLDLDSSRLADPGWFMREDRIGYSTYVDRFAGRLGDVAGALPHLRRLGVTYLHLLPFLRMREGADDGGFAVSDYGSVDPRFGDTADLQQLAATLRRNGVSLCVDVTLNHTSDDHPWALAARAGDPVHRRYYHVIERAEDVAEIESHLGQVFPETAPGNFTHVESMGGWVWTTFYPFQWDLNFSNPDVLCEILEALLALANMGVEVFRLDSIPYVWKRAGSDCRNLPEAHVLLQVLRLAIETAAPAVLLKAEAVVETHEAAAYLGGSDGQEAHLAYNNSLMVHLWAALAEGTGAPVRDLFSRLPPNPAATAWITYARCHDDIGWSVLTDAQGRSDPARQRVLRAFYAGETANSFSTGLAFQSGSATSAPASCGMLASLAGLERAKDDPGLIARARARIRLLHGLIAGLPGLPVIYMGDEIGLPNDWGYARRDRFHEDARGLHRPFMDWRALAQPGFADTPAGRIHTDLIQLLAVRRASPALASSASCEMLEVADARTLCAVRKGEGDAILLLANLSADPVSLALGPPGGRKSWSHDRLNPETVWPASGAMVLAPYALHWFGNAT